MFFYFVFMEILEMTKYITGALPCKNSVRDSFKGVISKGNWMRILWQEFDNEVDAIKWAKTVKNKEYEK